MYDSIIREESTVSKLDQIQEFEQLYKSEHITQINVQDYFQKLISSVISFSRIPIYTNLQIEPEYISAKKAVPLGLIITEAATNAIKLGFSEQSDARIELQFKK